MFVNGKLDGNNVALEYNKANERISGSEETKTGQNIVDKVANIYDLEGSRYDWTQEADGTDRRIRRGRIL